MSLFAVSPVWYLRGESEYLLWITGCKLTSTVDMEVTSCIVDSSFNCFDATESSLWICNLVKLNSRFICMPLNATENFSKSTSESAKWKQ